MVIKKILLFLALLMITIIGDAQDIIHTRNGKEIHCRLVDVLPGVVKYEKFGIQNGPVYSIAVEQVEKISYESGKTVTFEFEQAEQRSAKRVRMQGPKKPPNTFGWHIGFGASNIYGDLEETKWQMASSIGASFNLSLGEQNSVMMGVDILSVGCSLEDLAAYDHTDSAFVEISNWQQTMGYIGLLVMYRQYFNHGRNYFAEGGLYGSLLLSAEWQGDLAITDTTGQYFEESFRDDLRDFYGDFDYGLSFGIGGRIPVDKKGRWHITAEARFYYGLANIINKDFLWPENYKESNIFGMINIGVDLPFKASD